MIQGQFKNAFPVITLALLNNTSECAFKGGLKSRVLAYTFVCNAFTGSSVP